MADVPHGGSRATPLDSGKDGQPGAEAVTAERNPAGAAPVENLWPRLGRGFERGLSLSRIVVVVPVIVLLLSAMASFAYGTDVFFGSGIDAAARCRTGVKTGCGAVRDAVSPVVAG